MANALYPKFKAAILSSGLNVLTSNIKAALLDLDTYTYSAAHEFVADVTGIVARSPNLSSKTVAAATGWFDSANPIFSEVVGATVEGVLLFVDTGADGTSRLIGYFDTGLTGLPLTPDGSDVRILIDANGWFRL